jgi:hypothetical protein
MVYTGNHGIAVKTGSRPRVCYNCQQEIERGERYVRGCHAYHTLHFQDARGRPIYTPTTDLELSRSSIPLVTVTASRKGTSTQLDLPNDSHGGC